MLYLHSHLHLNTYTLVSLQNEWIFYLLHLNTNSEQPKIVFCICSQILQSRGKNEQIKEHMHLKLKVSKVSWGSVYWKHSGFVALIFFHLCFLTTNVSAPYILVLGVNSIKLTQTFDSEKKNLLVSYNFCSMNEIIK